MKVKQSTSHCVVKRGKSSTCHVYDERKVYGSVYAACYIIDFNHKKCERIANLVARKITALVKKKKMVASHHIFQQVVKELKKHNPHAAFMYETHRDIS